MRIVHVSPRLAGNSTEFPAPVRELAAAQAVFLPGAVQLVATAPRAGQGQVEGLELRRFPGNLPRLLGRSRALCRHLRTCPYEVVHAHCIGERSLHYALLAAQRHGAPLVVSPAGALGLGSTERLRFRCLLQRAFIHAEALEIAAGWHATSAEEADAIRACGFHQPICIAPPGLPPLPEETLVAARQWWNKRDPDLARAKVALCRVPHGGPRRLHQLLDAWPALSAAGWRLLLVAAGPGATARLKKTVAGRPEGSRIRVAESGAPCPESIAAIHLAIGGRREPWSAVATALQAGVPALVTADQPWRRLDLDETGWCVEWPEFMHALARVLATPPERLAKISRHAREVAAGEFSWGRAAERLLTFYRNLHG